MVWNQLVGCLMGDDLSDQGDHCGCGEKWLDLGSIWKVEPKGFPDRLDMNGEKEASRKIIRFWPK